MPNATLLTQCLTLRLKQCLTPLLTQCRTLRLTQCLTPLLTQCLTLLLTPQARAAELVAREDVSDLRCLERWLHATWELWHFTGVVNERTEVRGGAKSGGDPSPSPDPSPNPSTSPSPSPSPNPNSYQVRGGTFVHLAVNHDRLAAMDQLGKLGLGVGVGVGVVGRRC